MDKPSICILSTAYSPHWGGAEIAIQEIVERLKDQYDFTMLTPKLSVKDKDEEMVDSIRVVRLGSGGLMSKWLFPIRARKKFSKLHSETPVDYLWAMMASYAGIAGWLIKRKNKKIPYLLTLQSGDSEWFWTVRTAWWKLLFKKVYTSPDHIQAISTYLKGRAKKYGYTGQMTIVPNGVDVKKFSTQGRSDADTKILKKELGIEEDQKIIITTSRLVHKNAVDIIIKSLQYTKTPIIALILGSGNLERKLKVLASKLNLEDKIRFLGSVPNKDLQKYLEISDVFIRPSRSEGQGISFLEAMASGVPVIATPVGGIVDFLEDEKTGLFCVVDDAKNAASKIDRLLSDKKLNDYIKKNAQEMIRKTYSWDDISEKMNNIFKNLHAK